MRNIVMSEFLLAKPSPGEDGRRIVRHGLADVLAWLGEDVGPAPGQRTKADFYAATVADHGWDPLEERRLRLYDLVLGPEVEQP